ncbi:MAG: hypothetical protein AAGF95_01665 [Chloroflexota bacterium]
MGISWEDDLATKAISNRPCRHRRRRCCRLLRSAASDHAQTERPSANQEVPPSDQALGQFDALNSTQVSRPVRAEPISEGQQVVGRGGATDEGVEVTGVGCWSGSG